jgi:pimeloyl-ACP methyl ester carboxylesterase
MPRVTGDHEGQPAEGDTVQGRRHTVTSADGTTIGLLTAGTGPALLLVHGGLGRLERWQPLWGLLTGHWQVTAMDRPGWAAGITRALSAALPQATLAVLPGCGHEAIDAAPGLIYRQLLHFLG